MRVITPKISRWNRIIGITLAIIIPMAALLWPRYRPSSANRSFALLLFVVILWVTNAFPLFVTALSVPILATMGRMLRNDVDNSLLAPSDAMAMLLSSMYKEVIPVLLASFIIAASYEHFKSSMSGSGKIFSSLSANVPILLLAMMLITLTLCFGLGNVSCVIFVYTLLNGRLRGHVKTSTAKAFLMGISIAGNLGSYLTPVSSAQSVFIFSLLKESSLEITWLTWIKITIPTAYASLIVGWLYLYWYYELAGLSIETPQTSDIEQADDNNHINKEISNGKLKLWAVIIITLLTIILWATSSITKKVLGGMGMIAFIPIVLLFGLEILQVDDLRMIPWEIVLFMMGALALVTTVRSSGLLAALSEHMTSTIAPYSVSVQLVMVSLVLFFTSSIKSHTTAGFILMPVVVDFLAYGEATEGVIFMAATMAASLGMSFPFSSLSNMAVSTVADGDGNLILTSKDFLRVGTPIAILSYLISLIIPSVMVQGEG